MSDAHETISFAVVFVIWTYFVWKLAGACERERWLNQRGRRR